MFYFFLNRINWHFLRDAEWNVIPQIQPLLFIFVMVLTAAQNILLHDLFDKLIPHFSGAAPPSVYVYYSKSKKREYFPRVDNLCCLKKQTVEFNQQPKFLSQCAGEHVDCVRVFSFCLKTFNMAETQHGGRNWTKLWLYRSEANELFSCRSLDNKSLNRRDLYMQIYNLRR